MNLLAALVHLLEAPMGPFYSPKGSRRRWSFIWNLLAFPVCGCTGLFMWNRTVHNNGSDWQFPSMKRLAVGAPDMLLFTVLCARQVTIHCPVCTEHVTTCPMHLTCYISLAYAPGKLLFTILCTRHVIVHYRVHRTDYYSLSYVPANTTLSAFSSIFSTFDFNF
jgi:cytochrome c oxidase assembly factor CtaG